MYQAVNIQQFDLNPKYPILKKNNNTTLNARGKVYFTFFSQTKHHFLFLLFPTWEYGRREFCTATDVIVYTFYTSLKLQKNPEFTILYLTPQ